MVLTSLLLCLFLLPIDHLLSLLSFLPESEELELCLLLKTREVGIESLDAVLTLDDLILELLKVSLELRL